MSWQELELEKAIQKEMGNLGEGNNDFEELEQKLEEAGLPEEARKIHYGEADERGIIGNASAQEARALLDEGIEIAPLPVLPDDVN